ncbi:MAG: CsiV family protein [Oleiphilaceae bacterium]|nr:CsiV family protein [Oleiphilaceae bacterium]
MRRPKPILPLLALTGLILTLSLPVQASSDLYRVELLLFQRLSPGLIQEDMSRQTRDWLPSDGVPLWVDTDWQSTVTGAFIDRMPTEGLTLKPVRDSLERSGNYRVLSFTAWKEPFPMDYKTPPLVVDLTKTFDGERAIKGFIQIERRRYLHVNAQLYDLRPLEESDFRESTEGSPQPSQQQTGQSLGPGRNTTVPLAGLSGEGDDGLGGPAPQWETTTWLRELRRMRSEEVHYLDSPTIGLLVYFHPLEEASDSDTEAEDGEPVAGDSGGESAEGSTAQP